MKLTYLLLFAGLLTSPLSFAHKLTLDGAVERVKHHQKGKILSAKTVHHGKKTQYIIRVLTPKGRVKPITIRAVKHRHH